MNRSLDVAVPGSEPEERICACLAYLRDDRLVAIAREHSKANLIESALIGHFKPGHALISCQNQELDFLLRPWPKIFAFAGPNQLVQRPWFEKK